VTKHASMTWHALTDCEAKQPATVQQSRDRQREVVPTFVTETYQRWTENLQQSFRRNAATPPPRLHHMANNGEFFSFVHWLFSLVNVVGIYRMASVAFVSRAVCGSSNLLAETELKLVVRKRRLWTSDPSYQDACYQSRFDKGGLCCPVSPR
jgi:hypothetical protein